jgi:hypothetical protein
MAGCFEEISEVDAQAVATLPPRIGPFNDAYGYAPSSAGKGQRQTGKRSTDDDDL